MIKGHTLIIKGKVQGVFFRASAQSEALKQGLSGFVKNLGDDSVYIEVEGEENNIITFLNWCKVGPSSAKVSSVEIKEKDVVGFEGFQIKR